jgi:hypothetical protein
MERYAPSAKDLASRDVVSRAMTMEIRYVISVSCIIVIFISLLMPYWLVRIIRVKVCFRNQITVIVFYQTLFVELYLIKYYYHHH